MDVLVLGAGAVGCYLGGRLAQAGHSVTLVARGPKSEAIQRNGLSIVEAGEKTICRPETATTLQQAMAGDARFDVILVATKAYDAEAALEELNATSSSLPTVITLQNGIGIEDAFVRVLGSDKVVGASLTAPLSQENEHTILVERPDRGLALAPTLNGQSISQWVELFQEAGVSTVACENYRSMKWSKALLNMIANASSAILNLHPKAIYQYRPTYRLEMAMLKETLAVMNMQNLETIDLPGTSTGLLVGSIKYLPEALVKPFLTRIVGKGRGNKMPSFYLDLMAGKRQNEVVYHNGAVAKSGSALGISTPVNKALSETLSKLASQEMNYKDFEGKPDRLVAEVNKYRQGHLS